MASTTSQTTQWPARQPAQDRACLYPPSHQPSLAQGAPPSLTPTGVGLPGCSQGQASLHSPGRLPWSWSQAGSKASWAEPLSQAGLAGGCLGAGHQTSSPVVQPALPAPSCPRWPSASTQRAGARGPVAVRPLGHTLWALVIDTDAWAPPSCPCPLRAGASHWGPAQGLSDGRDSTGGLGSQAGAALGGGFLGPLAHQLWEIPEAAAPGQDCHVTQQVWAWQAGTDWAWPWLPQPGPLLGKASGLKERAGHPAVMARGVF